MPELSHNQRFYLAFAQDIALVLGGAGLALLGEYWPIPGTVISGIGFFGLFVLLHECVHNNGPKDSLSNQAWGEILGALTLNPYMGFKIQHHKHHAHLNHIDLDPTWNPWPIDKYINAAPARRLTYRLVRTYAWWLGTIFNILMRECNPKNYTKNEWKKVRKSIMYTTIGCIVAVSIAFYINGIPALVWYGAAMLVFHFVYSSVTLLQHTHIDPHQATWSQDANSVEQSTADIQLPALASYLCHYINYHIAHHKNPSIPFYRLRRASEQLSGNRLGIHAIVDSIKACHLVDSQYRFKSFEQYRREDLCQNHQ